MIAPMIAPKYPPLPSPPAALPGEPRAHYGARLFAWLSGPDGCTATCSTDDLELASYAGVLASASAQDQTVLTSISATRHVLATMIAGRQRLAAQLAAQDATVTSAAPTAPQGPDRPNEGPMAPLMPRPIVRPPSGGAVVPPFTRTPDRVEF